MDLARTFLDAFKFVVDRHRDDRNRVIEHVDELQRNADALVTAWEEVYSKLVLASEGKLRPQQLPKLVNVGFMAEIQARQETMSSALAGKVDDEIRQRLLRGLAVLLVTRRITNENYQRARDGLVFSYFSVQQHPDLSLVHQVEFALQQMRADAATLRAAISEYKATAT